MTLLASSIFEARELSKIYPTPSGELQALDSVSFSIEQGDFVSLLGPSGCGKSTLLNLLGGLMAPSSGELLLEGQPILRPSRDVGMMFQTPVLFPWRTVLENVMLSVEVLGLNQDEYRERARAVLDSVGLGGFADSYPRQLSGGMQQRAALSRVLVYEPKVLLLDEPFGALDEFTREAMNLELMRLWEQRSYSIVLVTHNIAEAVFMSKRVVVMTARPGRIARIVDIDLPIPRTLDVMQTKEYTDLIFEVRGILGIDR